MACTVLEWELARLAFSGLARDTEARVEDAMSNGGSRIVWVFKIVEGTLGDFENALADNILNRPAGGGVREGQMRGD